MVGMTTFYRYWQHFLALEADFAATSRYVEISTQNFATYSIEYAKLLLAVGSEIDVLCKVICETIDSAAKRNNIDDYRDCITAHCKIAAEEVSIGRYGLKFKPWDAWSRGVNPDWWKDYNGVKHYRHLKFDRANLENVANAICGLFVAVIYCHAAEKSTDSLIPRAVLLSDENGPAHLVYARDYCKPCFT
jgi:hypothetical protein